MTCPKCGAPTRVKDSVTNTDDREVYRLVYCTNCRHEFHTVEYEVVHNLEFAQQWNKWHRQNAKK